MKQHSPGFLRIVRDAKQCIRETDAHSVKRRLDRGDYFHLIDVREESEWEAGRLPSAIHMSKGVIEREIERLVPERDADIVVYCGGGYRSALVAENLQRMEYTNVQSMDGGIRGWRGAGYPVDGATSVGGAASR